jgi:chorismate mutase/prephenate dehydratase
MSKRKHLELEANTATVAFLGGSFSYTHSAARSFFPSVKDSDFLAGRSVKEVFDQVKRNEAHYGVLPAESSTSGSIQSVNDYLLLGVESGIQVIAEHREVEKIGLVSALGAKDVDIDMVFGHSNMMDNCGDYLALLDEKRKKAGKKAVIRVVALDSSTACSLVNAEAAKGNSTTAAAIASAKAAKHYNLNIVHEHIGSDLNSETRYIVIGMHEGENTDPLQIRIASSPGSVRVPRRGSCVFACNNEPGQVMKWSSCFAFRNMSILKIDSRPANVALHLNSNQHLITLRHFDILFYVDYEVSDNRTHDDCISNLKEFSTFFRQLGLYAKYRGTPVAVSPNEMLTYY